MMIPVSTYAACNWDKIPTVQSGRGLVGYRGGTRYQRGTGLGSFFRSLFKIARPIGKSLLKSVAKEGLETAALVGADLLEGDDLKSSVKSRAKKGASNLIRRAANKMPKRTKAIKYQRLSNQTGSGRFGYKSTRKPKQKRKQTGYGLKKYKRTKNLPKSITKSDYFGELDDKIWQR